MKAEEYKRLSIEMNPNFVKALRQCLGCFATGVVVITATNGPAVDGMTVNSFTSVSLQPPIVSWAIATKSRRVAFFEGCGGFAVNVLSAEQVELATRFSANVEDRFSGVEWFQGEGGAPLMRGCIAYLECVCEKVQMLGDHLILFGRVARFASCSGDPLVFCQGQFSKTNSLRAPIEQALPSGSDVSATIDNDLVSLVYAAYLGMTATFEAQQKATGVDLISARVLAQLESCPGQNIVDLATHTCFDARYVSDAVSALHSRGLITNNDDGTLRLTAAGLDVRQQIGKRWVRFRDRILSGLSQTQRLVAANALERLVRATKG